VLREDFVQVQHDVFSYDWLIRSGASSPRLNGLFDLYNQVVEVQRLRRHAPFLPPLANSLDSLLADAVANALWNPVLVLAVVPYKVCPEHLASPGFALGF